MPKASEEISKYNANSGGKTDSNLANDSLHLNGIPAEQYATKKYVQDYHGTKEAIQKEYIDEQDKSKLDEAKAYTDQVVSGQDFSNFAKVTDVQAVDTKLTNKINEDMANQKAYTDSKTQAVVNDVNNNFNEVHNAISTLNANQNELFQSVSSGKSKVAGAITDKGVVTSANDTFDTMASNIRNIQSGGGSTDPNYVNTADATAIASDILVGKTAYSQGSKVYGTLIAQTELGMPTYGTDTSGATAIASDIAYGKTAYARGQLLIGSMQNTDVEEIYGLNTDNYTIKTLVKMDKDPVTNDDITRRTKLAFSKNLDYCVSVTQLNNDTSTTYIESYAVNNEGMYVQGSTNASGETTYKKYRYTLEELGISGSIVNMALSCGGAYGDSKKCYLIIISLETQANGTTTYAYYKTHIFTYHLSENGVIGKMYDNETNIIINKTTEVFNCVEAWKSNISICTSNLTHNRFILCLKAPSTNTSDKLHYYNLKISELVDDINVSWELYKASGKYYGSANSIEFTEDDIYLQCYQSAGYGIYTYIAKIDIYNNYAPMFQNNLAPYTSYPLSFRILHGTNYMLDNLLNLAQVTLDGTGIKFTKIKRLTLSHNIPYDHSLQLVNFVILPGNEKIVGILREYYGGDNTTYATYLVVIDTTDILNDTTTTVTVTDYTTITNTGVNYLLAHNTSYTQINIKCFESNSNNLIKLLGVEIKSDVDNIFGLKYKGQYFYNQKARQLTAGQGDVKAGKTFIGWMGYPEIGTMEVSE